MKFFVHERHLFKFLVLIFIVSFSGCGGSSNTPTSQASEPIPQFATVRLTQVLLRAVPQRVTHERFTGFDAQGLVLFGPETHSKAATIELDRVPTSVVRLQIEYLENDTVVGLGSVSVDLKPGEVTEVADPPFEDVVAALSSLQVSPGGSTIADGSSVQYTVVGTFADNTQLDLTSSATWTSSNPTVATIAAGGRATGVDPGDTTITANIGPVSNSTTLTVSSATISSIAVTPNTPAIAAGTDQQFTATATLSDGSTQNVTGTASWTSGTTATATINSSTGLASAVSPGQSLITAAVGAVSGSTTLTVTNATVTSLVVSPGNSTIARGTTQQFHVIANFTSGPSQDVTSSAVWTSSMPGVATITSPGGLASAVTVGQTTISASFGGKSMDTTLNVGAAVISTIEVTPSNPVIADGTDQQFTATATLSDGSTQNVTGTASWTSGTTATATINSSTGLASAVSPGQAVVTAAVGAVSGSTTLTVTAAAVDSVTVTPATPSIANGSSVQFTATANLSNGSTQDVTSSAVWASATPAVATITSSGGLATAVTTGTSEISATFQGVPGSTTLTVTAATIKSITVTPEPAVLAKGENQQFTATGTYSDGSTSDVTAMVTWSSANTGVATVVAGGAGAGLASTAAVGNTQVTATLDAVQGSAFIVVTNAAVASITVTPSNDLITPGGFPLQMKAVATLTDGNMRDITSSAIWSSSAPATVSVTSAGGVATAQALGAVTITATESGASGQTTLTSVALGTAWRNRTVPFSKSPSFYSMRYLNGLFVGVGSFELSASSPAQVSTSANGRTWEDRSAPGLGSFNDIAFGNGVYVAARATASGPDSSIARTTDLQNWTAQTVGSSGELKGITFANDQFVAVGVGGGIYVSADGANWTDRSTGSNTIYKVAYGGGVWLATTGVRDTSGSVLRSTDNGVTWSSVSTPATDILFGIAYGNGVFVAGSRAGELIVSTDGGQTWTQKFDTGTQIVDHVAYGNGLFVAVNRSSTAYISSDNGATWTSFNTGSPAGLYAVAVGHNQIVLGVGDGKSAQTSP